MWLLEHAWIIPLTTFVSFWLILFFGRHLPKKGSEIGIAALAIAFVLSLLTAGAWINRDSSQTVEPLGGGHGAPAAEAGEGGHSLGSEPLGIRPVGLSTATEGDGGTGGEVQEGSEHGEAHHTRPAVVESTEWFRIGDVRIEAGILVDGLTVAMLVVVTTISLLVHIFSTNYMHGDRRYTYFFAALSLFTTGMLVLVTANNTLQMLFGWELMGLCSFMLIGHWWEEQANSNAALKAFFTTRTGDIGLLVGVSILFFGAGQTFDIIRINDAALGGDMRHYVLLMGAIALFVAVIGKSAQFPLHTWLPDAMAGPTPVSALIHAATMVVAGVYLVARLYGVFWEAFSIGREGHLPVNPIALIGGITVLIAAALAFVQSDIKKVLAYSTISQLGYMVMALGVGAWAAGVFHLFTHAFFKALLFLGAGSVSHAVHSFDMKKDMGGLRKYMPTTFVTFVIGTLALAGIPPLAGFWSKDEILLGALEDDYTIFLVIGLIGAFMTAAYMARCVWLTFFGEYRGGHHDEADDAHGVHATTTAPATDQHGLATPDHAPSGAGAVALATSTSHAVDTHDAHDTDDAHHGLPHESPPAITGPLVVLAVLSVFAGFLNMPGWFGLEGLWFAHWVEPYYVLQVIEVHKFNAPLALLSTLVAVAGLAASWLYYEKHAFAPLHGLTERNALARGIYRFLSRKYYLDDVYTDGVVGGIKGPIARGAYWTNQKVLDGVVNAAGVATRAVARFTYRYIDQGVIDGVVNGAGAGAEEAGAGARTIQTGRVQQYAAMIFGAVGVIALALVLLT